VKRLHAILFALGFAFLGFLVWRMGARRLWEQFTALGWGWVPIILAEGVAESFHAIGWRYCLSGAHRRMPLARVFRVHFAGYAVNFLTPTASLAGELSKAALLAGRRRGPEATAAVLIGKLSFAMAHLLLVIAGLGAVLPGLPISSGLRIVLLLSGAALAAGIGTFLLLQARGRLGGFLRRLAGWRIFPRSLRQFARPMERVDVLLRTFYRERPGDMVRSVLWHLVGYSAGILPIWCFLFLLGKHPGLATAARIWLLSLWIDLITFAVPLNLGTLEGGRLVAFRAFGFGALAGMTYGMVTRLAQLFWAGAGLVNYGLLIARPGSRGVFASKRIPGISPGGCANERSA